MLLACPQSLAIGVPLAFGLHARPEGGNVSRVAVWVGGCEEVEPTAAVGCVLVKLLLGGGGWEAGGGLASSMA